MSKRGAHWTEEHAPSLPTSGAWSGSWRQSAVWWPILHPRVVTSILSLLSWPQKLQMEFGEAGTRSGECGTTTLPFFKYHLQVLSS